MHLTSLPGDYGIGELGANAHRFVDTLASMGLSWWQFLPIGPTAYADSPYQSTSAYAGNPLLIDLASLRDDGLVEDVELSAFASLPRDAVDFGELIPLKTQLLARVGERFNAAASVSVRSARDDFVTAFDHTWLHDYALFEVLKTLHQQRAWHEWDPAYAMRNPEALRAIETAARSQIDSIKTIQFLFFEQWRKFKAYATDKGIRLMGDLPIYVAIDSADAWAHPDGLQLDEHRVPIVVAGVPPDYFSEDGQRWGNPLYQWEQHAADGYQWWISRVQHAMTLVDLVRLDHFRGLEAYWAIPANAATARDGEWRPGPGEGLLGALCDSLGALPMIAEDLGVITPEVEALRDRYALPGMKVLQFMVGEETFDPNQITENCVCYTGTHDNDTVLGWFNSLSATMQATVLANTQGQTETIHEDLIKLAFSTKAALAMVPMQDYLGLGPDARMNTPGTSEGNWRWRLNNDQITPQLLKWVQQALDESGRLSLYPTC